MLRSGKYWRHVTISDHCGCTCYRPTFCKKKNNHFDNSVDYVQILLCIENQWKFVSRNQRSISIHVHMLFTTTFHWLLITRNNQSVVWIQTVWILVENIDSDIHFSTYSFFVYLKAIQFHLNTAEVHLFFLKILLHLHF